MAGPGKQGKSKARRRSADMTISPDAPEWVAEWEASSPDWEEQDACEVVIGSSDLDALVYQRVRRNPTTGRLVDFAVAVQIRRAGVDEDWVDIERVDCAHGCVHIDRSLPNGKTEKDEASVPPECRGDLDKAFGWALRYVWDLEVRLKGWT